jgi:hypothetical protein
VAQGISTAWFALTATGTHLENVAAPLALEIELGSGSWETSLIPPNLDLKADEVDKVILDLLIVMGPKRGSQ